MSTILVWLLITAGGYNANNPVVIEKFATSEECIRVLGNLPNKDYMNGKCIQARIAVIK